jgi:SAM-dependent methyltransferase
MTREWFKDFYAEAYFKYRFEPRLDEIPAQEVDFIIDQGKLDLSGSARRRPRVFDICCGVGRHARPLAARGCEIVGVDISDNNISAARATAAKQGLDDRCRFDLGDIREYEPPADCDLAINIFTSFGYFESDDADAVIMRQAARSLKPGGRFILDIFNRESVIAHYRPMERRGDKRNYVIDETRLDLVNARVISTWTFVREGEKSVHTTSIRMYALHELVRMAKDEGLQFVKAFGSFAGEDYDRDSPRLIFVAEKAR